MNGPSNGGAYVFWRWLSFGGAFLWRCPQTQIGCVAFSQAIPDGPIIEKGVTEFLMIS